MEKIPRGAISKSDLRDRKNLPTKFYQVGDVCAAVLNTGALEIGVLEEKTPEHAVLLCNGKRLAIPHGEYWRAIGVEVELGCEPVVD